MRLTLWATLIVMATAGLAFGQLRLDPSALQQSAQDIEYVKDKASGEFHRVITTVEAKTINKGNLEDQLLQARAQLERLQRIQAKQLSDADALVIQRVIQQRDRKIVPLSVALPAEIARTEAVIVTLEKALK